MNAPDLQSSGLHSPDLRPDEADYQRIECAIRYIEANRLKQPTLDDIASAVHLSPYHFQRLFTRWAGVSPKRFLGFLTYAHARALLEGSASVLDAALDSGLSGPGRLHDLFLTFEAVTPGDVKRRGEGLTIRYGFHPSPFGPCILGVTERGICCLSFVEPRDQETTLTEMAARWPAAKTHHDQEGTAPLMDRIFYNMAGMKEPLRLHVSGTNFQIKVWEALLKIPLGRLVTYGQLAQSIGHPRAARAVGTALNRNPLAFIIPCHSVIRSLQNAAGVDGYRWGSVRRKAIIGWEEAHLDAAE